MPHLKSFHNRPIRIGRLLWRPGQSHEVQPHWMKKSVMRAVTKKGWLREVELEPEVKEPIKQEKIEKKSPIIEESPREDSVPSENLLSDVGGGAMEEPEVKETPPEPQAAPIEEDQWPQPKSRGMPDEPFTRSDLEAKSFKELKDIAYGFDVTGRAKSDLIDRILDKQNGE